MLWPIICLAMCNLMSAMSVLSLLGSHCVELDCCDYC